MFDSGSFISAIHYRRVEESECPTNPLDCFKPRRQAGHAFSQESICWLGYADMLFSLRVNL